MAHDQIFTLRDDFGVELKIIPVALNLDKEIHLLHIFEEDHSAKKKFIRNELVLVGNQILTSTFSDTVHFWWVQEILLSLSHKARIQSTRG